MRRTGAALFIGAMVVATALVAPAGAAQASPAKRPSTSCSFVFKVTFDPGLQAGDNPGAFFTWDLKLDGCTGGDVSSATGYGGAKGDLQCHAGALRGRPSAKMQVNWDTGKDSGINFRIDFTRSRYGGKVLGDYLKGEKVRAKHFTFTPTGGDCAKSPLVSAEITGTVSI
jgi:hypothetical protein